MLFLSRCLSFSHQTSTFSRDKLPSEEFPDKRYTLRRITRFMTFFDVFAAPVCSSSASVILVVPFVIVLWPRRRRRFTIMPSRAFPFILHFRLNSDQPFLACYLLFFAVTSSTITSLAPDGEDYTCDEISEVVEVSKKYIKCFACERFICESIRRMNKCVRCDLSLPHLMYIFLRIKSAIWQLFTIFYWEKIRII